MSTSTSDDSTIHAFRTVPRTGVIYVTTEASRLVLPCAAA